MLLRLVAEFFSDSFESSREGAAPKPTSQRLCAEAIGRFATDAECDELARRFARAGGER